MLSKVKISELLTVEKKGNNGNGSENGVNVGDNSENNKSVYET
jgi:hypothetical protein